MNDNKLYFKGYPSGNLLKIVCKVLEYWINSGFFPILFYKIHAPGGSEKELPGACSHFTMKGNKNEPKKLIYIDITLLSR